MRKGIVKNELIEKLDALVDSVFKTDRTYIRSACVERADDKSFTICFRDHDTSFENLQKLSELFGTRNINFGSESRDGGYCDSCHYSYSVNLVTVTDYVLPD